MKNITKFRPRKFNFVTIYLQENGSLVVYENGKRIYEFVKCIDKKFNGYLFSLLHRFQIMFSIDLKLFYLVCYKIVLRQEIRN
jgi:hypothetical protein